MQVQRQMRELLVAIHGELLHHIVRRADRKRLAAMADARDIAEFAERRDAGSFLLHWRAHGLDYGIAATVAADRAAGRTVIANVSRSVVAEARAALTPVRIVQIVAPAPVLAARLARRGRESATDIQLRMTRDAAEAPVGADVTTIANDGALDR